MLCGHVYLSIFSMLGGHVYRSIFSMFGVHDSRPILSLFPFRNVKTLGGTKRKGVLICAALFSGKELLMLSHSKVS